MRTVWWKFLVIFGVYLVAAVPAHAQPLFPHAESIECMVANADLVFIAKLVKIDDGEHVNGVEVHNTTIAVEQTVKMEIFNDVPYTGVQIYMPKPAAVLEDWKKRACPLLVAHDSDAPRATQVIELVEGSPQVMRADLTLLRKPDAVIQAAQEAARRLPTNVKRVHTFKLTVPRELVVGTTWDKYYDTGGHLVLSVPADKQLEKRAAAYLRSQEEFKRWEGARAMRYFKSRKNIARVQSLLNDPSDTVRTEARQTLKYWGAETEQPALGPPK